ncbi:MAG: Rne/Rng family ribonuclease [Acidimicrobiia bacterium]|nr:Rne/Rng family ribonuclease [Acidimicrobiia bacterium]
MPHQIQIVVLEGPVLVEHYVARSDKASLVGNVYLGKVRNVLPGMEAAFVDFGEGKNGVLYAGDIQGRRSRIENHLKNGDDVLVQVSKDAMGHKGARLTNEVSLAGRYLVLAPGAEIKGISRRLGNDERDRLRRIIDKVRPKDFGVIVRTAAESASEEDLLADVQRLEKSWRDINVAAGQGGGPKLLHEEPPLEIRVIRENFTRDFRQLLVDDASTKDRISAYLEETEPDLASKVKLYREKESLFERYHVDDQLRKALDRKVWLPSGGHVVIERTEALTVIDVNTGRFVGHSNLEETVLQNNLEAAEEVARQLRLRDIGGIIVIDFIDMEIARNRDAVIARLEQHLAKDKTRTQVFDVSNLGLVEMTRKNVSEGLLESFSEVCDKCSGRGVLLHEEAATGDEPMPHRASESARS